MQYKKLKKKVLKDYPDKYFDFSDGIDISEIKIKRLIKKVIKKAKKYILKYNKENTFYTISTGNTKIFVEIYKQDNGLFEVFVAVTKNYIEECYHDVKF